MTTTQENTQQPIKELLDEEGENRAVRSFLMQYSCDRATTIGAMRKHMDRSGWPLHYCPQFALDFKNDGAHLSKAGAQIWLRHLFDLEPIRAQRPSTESSAWNAALDAASAAVRDRAMSDEIFVSNAIEAIEALKSQPAPVSTNELAAAIHYPACWDTAAYPALADALSAVYDHFKCSECAPVSKMLYSFDRFTNGVKMADGIGVHATSMEMAEKKAKVLADHGDTIKFVSNEPCHQRRKCSICTAVSTGVVGHSLDLLDALSVEAVTPAPVSTEKE